MSKSPDDMFLDGFNSGYTLANLDPKLAEDLSTSVRNQDDHFVQGFHSGRQEYIREISKEQTYEEFVKSQQSVNPTQDKSNDLEIEL